MPYAKKSSAKSNKSSAKSSYNKSGSKSSYKKTATVTPVKKVDPDTIWERFTQEQKQFVNKFVTGNIAKFSDVCKAKGLFVSAVPGSGKSTTGVHAAYMYLQYAANKGNSLLLTSFAVKSVNDLQEKAKSYGMSYKDGITINGIHSIQYRRLTDYLRNSGCVVNTNPYAKRGERFVVPNKYIYMMPLNKKDNNSYSQRLINMAESYSSSANYIRQQINRWIGFMHLWLVSPDPERSQYNIMTPKEVADMYRIEYKSNEHFFNDMLSLATDLMKEGYQMSLKKKHPSITFNEMVAMPWYLYKSGSDLMNTIMEEGSRYDAVICDEIQDLSYVQLRVVMDTLIKDDPNSVVAVMGQKEQAIYGFGGAPTRMIEDYILGMFGFEQHNLTYSFRCGKIIVDEAAKLFSGIQPGPNNPDGKVIEMYEKEFISIISQEYKAWLNSLGYGENNPIPATVLAEIDPVATNQNPVTVICRTIAPLVKIALECILNEIPFNSSKNFELVNSIRGSYYELKEFCEENMNINLDENYHDLLNLVDQYYEQQVAIFKDAYEGDNIDVDSDNYLADLRDNMEGLVRCYEAFESKDINSLIKKIEPYINASCPMITLSTGHGCKGLEWKRVALLQNTKTGFRVNHPKMSMEDRRQEEHVEYVMKTRAQLEMIYLLQDTQTKGDNATFDDKRIDDSYDEEVILNEEIDSGRLVLGDNNNISPITINKDLSEVE